jgi:CheY-like chemotaxis protein
MQRVLVCEDSAVYATALIRLLEYDGDIKVCAVCTTAAEAMAALPRVRPDLVTMDLELPDMNGLKAVEEIMSSRPLPILVLSAGSARRTASRNPRSPSASSTPSRRTISASVTRPAPWPWPSGGASASCAGPASSGTCAPGSSRDRRRPSRPAPRP